MFLSVSLAVLETEDSECHSLITTKTRFEKLWLLTSQRLKPESCLSYEISTQSAIFKHTWVNMVII